MGSYVMADEFCRVTFVKMSSIEGHSYYCIRSMVNFSKPERSSPQGTMLKYRASWKGLDRESLLSSDPFKNINIVFMTYKLGCYMVIDCYYHTH